MMQGGYSIRYRQVEDEHIKHLKSAYQDERHDILAKSNRLRHETNKRRKALASKRKTEQQKEECRRQQILAQRKEQIKEATEKYMRQNKHYTRVNSENEDPTPGPTLDDALKLVRGYSPKYQRQNSAASIRSSDGNNMHHALNKPYYNKYGYHTSTHGVVRQSSANTNSANLHSRSLRNMNNSRSLFEQHLEQQQALLAEQQQQSLHHFNTAIAQEIEADRRVAGEEDLFQSEHKLMKTNSTDSVDSLDNNNQVDINVGGGSRVSPPSGVANNNIPAPSTEMASNYTNGVLPPSGMTSNTYGVVPTSTGVSPQSRVITNTSAVNNPSDPNAAAVSTFLLHRSSSSTSSNIAVVQPMSSKTNSPDTNTERQLFSPSSNPHQNKVPNDKYDLQIEDVIDEGGANVGGVYGLISTTSNGRYNGHAYQDAIVGCAPTVQQNTNMLYYDQSSYQQEKGYQGQQEHQTVIHNKAWATPSPGGGVTENKPRPLSGNDSKPRPLQTNVTSTTPYGAQDGYQTNGVPTYYGNQPNSNGANSHVTQNEYQPNGVISNYSSQPNMQSKASNGYNAGSNAQTSNGYTSTAYAPHDLGFSNSQKPTDTYNERSMYTTGMDQAQSHGTSNGYVNLYGQSAQNGYTPSSQPMVISNVGQSAARTEPGVTSSNYSNNNQSSAKSQPVSSSTYSNMSQSAARSQPMTSSTYSNTNQLAARTQPMTSSTYSNTNQATAKTQPIVTYSNQSQSNASQSRQATHSAAPKVTFQANAATSVTVHPSSKSHTTHTGAVPVVVADYPPAMQEESSSESEDEATTKPVKGILKKTRSSHAGKVMGVRGVEFGHTLGRSVTASVRDSLEVNKKHLQQKLHENAKRIKKRRVRFSDLSYEDEEEEEPEVIIEEPPPPKQEAPQIKTRTQQTKTQQVSPTTTQQNTQKHTTGKTVLVTGPGKIPRPVSAKTPTSSHTTQVAHTQRSSSAGTSRRGPFLRPHPPHAGSRADITPHPPSNPPSGRATIKTHKPKQSHASPPYNNNANTTHNALNSTYSVSHTSQQPYNAQAYSDDHPDKEATINAIRNSGIYDENGMRLDRTPTDDEINWLWDKVRTCLQHKDGNADPQQASLRQSANVNTKYIDGNAIAPQLRVTQRVASANSNGYTNGFTTQHKKKVSMDTLNNFSKRSSLLHQRKGSGGTITYPEDNTAFTTVQSIPQHTPTPSTTQPAHTNVHYHDRNVSESMAAFLTAEMLARQSATESVMEREMNNVQTRHRDYTTDTQHTYNPSTLSVEEQRLMQSLERLNERLEARSCSYRAQKQESVKKSHAMVPRPPAQTYVGFRGRQPLSANSGGRRMTGNMVPRHNYRTTSAGQVRMSHTMANQYR